jgi:hypothetical protein
VQVRGDELIVSKARTSSKQAAALTAGIFRINGAHQQNEFISWQAI